jgi:hypothetical protein
MFTVTLSAASSKTVTVNYATADSTATAGTDYTSVSGTLTFNPGETSKTVNVSAKDDMTYEADETFFLNLSGAVNAAISHAQGVGTIINDDDAPFISINDVSHAEGNAGTQTYTFTVTMDRTSVSTVTVDYATSGGTATAGEDFITAAGKLTFDPGDTSKTISVTVNGDNKFETDESFYLNLTNPSNAAITDAQGVGTITNDDTTPTVTLSINNASISETGGSSTVTATLSNASYQDVAVTLGYTGTATGGTDYTTSGTITIPAGNASGTATITAVSDAIDENDETVIVDITGVTNGTESGSQQVTTTITDDDAAPTISVNDPSVTEGNSGTTTLTFTVTLSAAIRPFPRMTTSPVPASMTSYSRYMPSRASLEATNSRQPSSGSLNIRQMGDCERLMKP